MQVAPIGTEISGVVVGHLLYRDLGMDVWWNPPDPRKEWAELD